MTESRQIQKIRAQVLMRTNANVGKFWPDWWRELGGFNGTMLQNSAAAERLLDTAPSDMAFGFAYGLFTIRSELSLLGDERTTYTEEEHARQRRVLLSIDFHNAVIVERHPAFNDLPVPPYGPDFELWLHQAPNDFAYGTVSGFFMAYDTAARAGVDVRPQVRRLSERM